MPYRSFLLQRFLLGQVTQSRPTKLEAMAAVTASWADRMAAFSARVAGVVRTPAIFRSLLAQRFLLAPAQVRTRAENSISSTVGGIIAVKAIHESARALRAKRGLRRLATVKLAEG